MGTKKTKGPQFIAYFDPILVALTNLGGSGRPGEVVDKVAELLDLSEEEQSATLAGGQSRFANRVAWARFYLVKAGYIDSSKYGVWTLTDKGRNARLDASTSYEVFRSVREELKKQGVPSEASSTTYEMESTSDTEALPLGGHRFGLLHLIKTLPPEGFERLCQRLLRESGFEKVVVTGRSGDGGIDGIGTLQLNPFVSFKVLFQCKRYDGSVGSGHLRDFRGAMMGRADKGIVITTGSFTSDASKEASRDGVPPIELVDGEKLVDMFEALELGLVPVRTYRIEETFFDEFK